MKFRKIVPLCAGLALAATPLVAQELRPITLNPLGTYASGVFDAGSAEIVAHDPATQRLFVVNARR